MTTQALTRMLAGMMLVVSVSPAPARTPTLDEMLGLRAVRNARLAPDGSLVCFEVTEADWQQDAYVTQLWLGDTRSGATWQLTRGSTSSDAAAWSPDGRWIAFMTERKVRPAEPGSDTAASRQDEDTPAARQIWLISPKGGEAWPLTRHPAAIDTFRWSGDGRTLAFVAPAPRTKASRDRKEKYGAFEVFEEDFDQNQIWTVDVSAAEARFDAADATQVTSDPRRNVTDLDWSPDGKTIVFSATTSPLLAFSETADLFVVDLARNDATTTIVALEGPETTPRFSPDGTAIAFETALGQRWHYYANSHIAMVRLADVRPEAARQPQQVVDLTGGFDEDASLVDWSPRGIYFQGLQKTSSHLFRVDPAAKAITRVTSPDQFFLGGVSFTSDFSSMAFTALDPVRLPEVFVAAVPAPGSSLEARRLTDLSAQLAGWTLGTQEMVAWRSRDGAEIEGVLHKPADFDPGRKYPLLVLIHGGPTGISRPVRSFSRYYPVPQFLARGALVLEPNYRGSAGYGSAFRALNVRNLGVGDMWDVMSGVDALIAKGLVDPGRLGAMGWSQGGYISAFLATNTDRFKAISVGAGISNWMTYYVNTDITPFTRQYLHATPWDDPAVYARTSPMTTITKARTPTLIQHGERDRRVPPPNAFELYRGLRDVGVPARLIVYGGFGHGITKPKSNRAVLQHNLDWFAHHVFGEPLEPTSPLFGSGAYR